MAWRALQTPWAGARAVLGAGLADAATAIRQGFGQEAPQHGPALWLSGRGSVVSKLQVMPFDALRDHYAMAVQRGLVRRSMLASRDVEKMLDLFEKLTLGPFARRV